MLAGRFFLISALLVTSLVEKWETEGERPQSAQAFSRDRVGSDWRFAGFLGKFRGCRVEAVLFLSPQITGMDTVGICQSLGILYRQGPQRPSGRWVENSGAASRQPDTYATGEL